MRWFVEVSRVGGDDGAQKFCVEAKQWQAALQEARRLRGESGPLSKFSIEMMDSGYRAVDPASKVRYVVSKAPADAPLAGPDTKATRSPESAPPTEVASTVVGEPPASASSKRKVVTVPPDEVPRVKSVPPPADTTKSAESHSTQRSMQATRAPEFEIVRERAEEPRPDTPIIYREVAYAVAASTSLDQARLLLWTRFEELKAQLASRPAGKFFQLAVFDHVFRERPARPPLATLAWKDWRGEPVVRLFDGAAQSAPKPEQAEPAAPKPERAESKPEPKPEQAAQAAPKPEPAAPKPKQAEKAGARKPSPDPVATRRRGEDLIGELFEILHELHFLPDVMSGADFVVGVLKQALPCEALILHLFDINNNQFVVVRALAPAADELILERTPDREPFVNKVMRKMRSMRFDSAKNEPGFTGGRWARSGVKVESALAAPIHQTGRYLGLVELVNPEGGGPFMDSEANALDYICEQFAEFLAARPIVLDAEVVTAKR
ncbi:MAG: GAF domain-containing protein [Sorangiineae bacterium]|nr:GAF domain-containing protein [Polyangiaceae bacterium]MEB2322199.1 GAF domain-containing protein [Sorangiineae bacterium]